MDVIGRLTDNNIIVPVQVLGELYSVLVRKAGRSRSQARDAVLAWHDSFSVAETTGSALIAAADLATAHRLSFWDALILAASAGAEAQLLLTEDLREGFSWSGLTIVNPMASGPHRLLAAALRTRA